MKRIILTSLLVFFGWISLSSQVISQWRGSERTGIYRDTDLLEVWPETGPEMIWSIDSIPEGYSSVAVAYDMVFFTGISDSMDIIAAVDNGGKLIWQTPFGRAWDDSFPHSRSTPTIEDHKAYVSSGLGDIACINCENGEIIWSRKASEEFEGTYGKWGISESLLIVDEKLIFTPGGNKTTILAFDKLTGELLWASKSLEDAPSYASPLFANWKEKDMIINSTQNWTFGINPEDGEFLWKFQIGVFAGGEWRSNNQTNTPIFDDGKIYITSGYDHKSVQITLSEEANAAYFNWVDKTLDVHHGGVVKIGDYIYGSNWINNRKGNWVCLDWNTGKVQYEAEWETKGSIIYANGMLYCYDEKNGNIAMVKADPTKFEVTSSFQVPMGKGPHWSHLVIDKGVLYVRHEDALMAYDITEK
jgi:outer membrane protein assembly factor BamB